MISVCVRLPPMTSVLHFSEIPEIIETIRIAIIIGIHTTSDSHEIPQSL